MESLLLFAGALIIILLLVWAMQPCHKECMENRRYFEDSLDERNQDYYYNLKGYTELDDKLANNLFSRMESNKYKDMPM